MIALMQMGLGPLDHDGRHWIRCWLHRVPAVHPHWHFWRNQVQHCQVQSTAKTVWPRLSAGGIALDELTAVFLTTTALYMQFSCTLGCHIIAFHCAPTICCCFLSKCKGRTICAIQVADSSRRLVHCLAVQCDLQHSPGVLVHLGGCECCSSGRRRRCCRSHSLPQWLQSTQGQQLLI